MAVITISREYGSGGDEIACRVAELLGYRLLDKQMMLLIASQAGLEAKDVIDPPDDQHEVLTFFERMLGHKVAEAWVAKDAAGDRIVELGELDSKRYVSAITGLINTAYEQGNVVIIGRGSQAVLHGKPGVLHVRVEAPFEERVRRVKEQQRFANPADARSFVEGRDTAAADYIRSYFDADWSDPALYHLVVNTVLWDTETAARVVADAVEHVK